MTIDGLTTVEGRLGAAETMDRLEQEIQTHGMVVFARIDHAALAKAAGMELRPTAVILFGNPKGGTPLMQASQRMGIDLPLKILVWEDASGKTQISYNEPVWLAERHGAGGVAGAIGKLTEVVRALAVKVSGETVG